MNKELDFIKDMFDRIAPKYDFLNRLLSMGQDIIWRTQMVKAANLAKNSRVLDVACGTCDVALEVNSQLKGHSQIFGLDFSFGMLRLGKQKLIKKQNSNIALLNADALNLPFNQQVFDAVFIAFGIRNIIDRQRAITSFFNVLNNGGRVAVLELTTPEKGILRSLYLLYFQKILPIIGSFFSKHNNAYTYLPESVLKFPNPVEFSKIMKKAGFENIRFKPMTFGIVTLFIGIKP
ncbi:MAG: bifunctional demethylmenaquinone methyltransferase/2-methoxy-6-polyprenyl-1,4-benzoquinol methylase UbiE [Desulfobacula sp.]|jgi:demethylmenaquinone methyltransferase/2-methoxy-6-polyprenyl-1,4-benzoquinol methylase|uniref:bifunctional demethylmenaquinone methyltransferase/2-methoxy-6-polyprenyl-1,4-benzoquinol methylase UbiE n=1 Tax=Desulfobacula sp. TaxID=2593537 RepID=UPI001DF01BE0|nr:bifunctional demethylmenaquinone methyltransferase/2-methoxy-6-polyprenyl-1,4-benzoquinol methylase UbiE [Desulfobacula sp.]MBT3486842.1 bifunctional demethylmenaquinone methyltransferase/2-methoxy-6-polyprenyl-1,4-benzoquinol methylase UbiE [Desulfobacula sp.]MBT3806002.1 bifunctional demethylmenaquinone methyltransferase/2-methoxy-6-polyprenyl-1,4-benzoquinol methylase UbiE [Desulfobacula sp.]MBT4026909.1 bifunctional demethylmenaquinone methyltransferase/2-methoxy-6-polyprenyl-1,4-benzoqui